MATIDLGKIKLVWRGTYAGGTAYVPDDVVEYTDTAITSTYICTTASTGNAPSSGGTVHGSWAYMAKGAAGSPTTTRGDIIYRGASADARLAKGSAGKVLTMGANDPEWGAFGGKVIKFASTNVDGAKTSTANGGPTDQAKGVELFSLAFACRSTTSTVLIMTNPINCYESTNVADNFWLAGWQGSTFISAVSNTPHYSSFSGSLNSGSLGYFGKFTPGNTNSITYSIRGGMNGGNGTANFQNANGPYTGSSCRSHMFILEMEA